MDRIERFLGSLSNFQLQTLQDIIFEDLDGDIDYLAYKIKNSQGNRKDLKEKVIDAILTDIDLIYTGTLLEEENSSYNRIEQVSWSVRKFYRDNEEEYTVDVYFPYGEEIVIPLPLEYGEFKTDLKALLNDKITDKLINM